MKRIIPLLLIIFSLTSQAQQAARVIPSQANPQGKAKNIVYIDTSQGLNRILNAELDSILLKQSSIAGLSDSLKKKMDTAMAMQMVSVMRQSIVDSSLRQHYGDTDTYDLTRAKALEWFFTKIQTDGRYLQSFSESDPVYNANGQKYVDTSTNGYDLTKYQADIWYPRKSALGASAYSNSYNDLINKPSIPTNTNQLTNGAGFITGINSAQVVAALGYTPYNGATNPNGYITSSSLSVRNKAGVVSNAVLFVDTFSVSSATPTIDLSTYISAAGKTNCRILSAVAYRASATTSNSPNVTVTGMSNTGASLIFNQTNTSTVTILSINVLSGLPTILTPDPTNVKVLLTAYFY